MPKKTSTNVGNYLLDSLYSYGVEYIFGIPGDYILQFDRLIEQHKIAFINGTRENTAGYMADAYARLKGLGVVCITYGVGINIANALSQAYAESSPIVVISGTATVEEFNTGHRLHHLLNQKSAMHQMDTTQLEIFTHLTVDQAVLTSPEEAKGQIDRVLWSCLKHQKPVYIEIPRNISTAMLPSEQGANPIVHSSLDAGHFPSESLPQSNPLVRAIALQPLLQQVEDLLLKSKKPLIWAGHEILRYNLSAPLIAFAEKYQIPIVSTLLGKTTIDEHHPLFLGVYQGKMSRSEVQTFVDSCDCLLQFGVILSDVDTGIFTAKLDYRHKVSATGSDLSIDCQNFYGIPFPDFIHALSESRFKVHFNHFAKAAIPHIENPPFTPKPDAEITAERLFACIASQLTPEHIVATDFGDCLFGCLDFVLAERSFLSCAYFGSLGFGTPAAIAAQLAEPKRRTIGIIGDGAFQMTCTELSTALRYGLDPVIIVLNNHGYGTERPLLEGPFNDVHNWNYSMMPQFLNGGVGVRVTSESAFFEALQNALKHRGQFHLIEVELRKTDFSPALSRFLSFAKNKQT